MITKLPTRALLSTKDLELIQRGGRVGFELNERTGEWKRYTVEPALGVASSRGATNSKGARQFLQEAKRRIDTLLK